MTRTRGALIAAALAGAVLMSGCAGQVPSTAAIVGGTTITESSLSQTTSAVEDLIGEPATGTVRLSVLQYKVWGVLADRISEAKGITISDSDRQEAVTGLQLTELADNAPTRDLAMDAADLAALASQMTETDFLAAVAQTDVVLNPRYGSWDASQVTVTGLTGETGSLSKAATTQG